MAGSLVVPLVSRAVGRGLLLLSRGAFLAQRARAGALANGGQEPTERAPQRSAVAARRRNILFITTDQQRFDSLGITGHPTTRTPHIDALAREGILYRRA